MPVIVFQPGWAVHEHHAGALDVVNLDVERTGRQITVVAGEEFPPLVNDNECGYIWPLEPLQEQQLKPAA